MKRIYETDSYIKELRTVVTASGTDDKGRNYVELEDTIFFPEEGGQNADTGELLVCGTGKKAAVLGGIISGRNTCSSASVGRQDNTEGVRIRYIVSDPVAPGTEILCKLDWDDRFDRMQNHSGEHILSGLMHKRFGVDNVGFHLSDNGPVTVDFNSQLSYRQLMEIQDETNRVIWSNVPVRVSFPTKEELKGIDYRSKIEIDGQVRLISIGEGEEIDICACCAPHVAVTGQIGILKILSVINWKGGIRLSMLCGRRALEYINREHDILTDLAKGMSTETVNIPGIVDSYREEIVSLRSELAGLKEKTLLDKAGKERIIFTDEDIPAPVMKNVYNALAERYDGFVGIFVGDDGSGYRYNAGSRDLDSRDLAEKLKETFGARGGGSPDMIQGRVTAGKEEIYRLFTCHDGK